jgi:hypothetical protein
MKKIILYTLSMVIFSGSLPVFAQWIPTPGTTFYWQLTGTINTNKPVQMYDVDLFDTPQATIDALHNQGKVVICYFSAGTWENWRADQAQFPAASKGKSNGWAGEKWLDIRNPTVLTIMKARIDTAFKKSCDGVEPDNVDGYSNTTGFPLKSTDQLTYNKAIASYAHYKGLSVGLKNDVEQIQQLVSSFDWALNEECFAYNECAGYSSFINARKAVFNAEYNGKTTAFCPKAKAMGLSSALFSVNLNGSLFTPCL